MHGNAQQRQHELCIVSAAASKVMLARQKIDMAFLSTKIATSHLLHHPHPFGLRDIVIEANESTLACESF